MFDKDLPKIHGSMSVEFAIGLIVERTCRGILVIDDDNRLIGVLSEGDLLRYVSKGLNLQVAVGKMCRKAFIFLNEYDIDKAKSFMHEFKILFIPIVGNNMEVIDIITIHDLGEA